MSDEEQKPPRPANRIGASPERMRELTRLRMEMAKKDPSKKGGRPKKNFTKLEAEEHALKRLMPKALQVLEEQLESPDERVKQKAALEVIAYVKGKPTQTVKSENTQVHTIRYESAAWMGGEVVDGELVSEDPPELPPAAA